MIFQKARLKLTAFYLIIIMIISIVFSLVIYRGVVSEFDDRFNFMETKLQTMMAPLPYKIKSSFHLRNELEASKHKVISFLLYANGFILLISGGIGYFLAGLTLKPIEEIMDDHKRFIGDASHELRTPLTTLKTSTEVAMRDKKLSLNEAKKALSSNLEEVGKLQALTNMLLGLSQYQSTKNNFNFNRFNLKETVNEAFRKIKTRAKNKNIELKINSSDIEIKANKTSIEELLLIFLDNAIKFTPKSGKVSLSTAKNGRNVQIKITDTGTGIDKVHLPFIFNRFYKVDKTRSKNNSSGFGLGLSIAKKIVDLHNGTISVSSTSGYGSTFIIKLPL